MEKETWGGARPGAGRKKGSVKDGAHGRKKIFQTASISGTPEEIARLKANAQAAGQSVSRYILSQLVGEVEVNTGKFIGIFDSLSELLAYSGQLANNDEATVQTYTKKYMIMERYKWSGTSWIYISENHVKLPKNEKKKNKKNKETKPIACPSAN